MTTRAEATPAVRGVRVHARSRDGTGAIVIGAGPYGLAAAAHLRAAGVDTRVFGRPMASWERHMPAGMLLRSLPRASFIADPGHEFGLDRFEQQHGLPPADPVPLERFVAYGHWFRSQAVPDMDARLIKRLDRAGSSFSVEFEEGGRLQAGRVIVAAGIVTFARRPAVFDGLGPDRFSHVVDHDDLGIFKGRRVLVLGGGQSALESGALLAEGGAEPEILVRRPAVKWLSEDKAGGGSLRHLAYRRIALGGPHSSWLLAWPAAWRKLPLERRERLAYAAIGPAGAGWLRPRLAAVPITTSESIERATALDGGVQLRLAGGGTRQVDHVLLGTGYQVDIERYAFLPPELLAQVRRRDGYPVLGAGFESSVPGLHFVGAPAALSFGPLMRFVCGTWAAARGLTRGIVGREAPRAGFSW